MTTKLVADVVKKYNVKDVNPKLAAFALLGMLNWTYQWYKASGSTRAKKSSAIFSKYFCEGILGVAWAERPRRQGRSIS